ncbi:hypothetical protein GCM10011515_26060 [Tsuneonella deserti]|uniref:Secreted protein n=1 Tax=Tsuneonella deserti TaxID=2035528 RepID=A0ABQ1SAG2_9SPHN|nr:hypothetical protein [Tsuneonella deserti]GGE05309.1 hypothetical protein GCM10011515_26060 [Tsuneonella deserti]
MSLDPLALAAILALIAVAALLLWWLYHSRRTSALRDRFGDTEYERTLQAHGARGKAEADLIEREKRVAELELRPLTADQQRRFSGEWHEAKARFVDDPAAAVGQADRVLGAVMEARGYPVADFDARYESLTVDHGQVARHYRAGHDIAACQLDGRATTEDLRQAMIHYEALFGELIEESTPRPREEALHNG